MTKNIVKNHMQIEGIHQNTPIVGQIGLYARRPVRFVPLTANNCRLKLAWSSQHALWTLQQWACVMFSDEFKFGMQSDSRRTFLWRVQSIRYYQEKIIKRHCFSSTECSFRGNYYGFQNGTACSNLNHGSPNLSGRHFGTKCVFWGVIGTKFIIMHENARPHLEKKLFQSEDITLMDCPAFSPDMNPGDMLYKLQPINHLLHVYRNFGEHCLVDGVIFSEIR
ncbi:transposable element Tcb1 transposase [Trichonephila clavipes]|nr:transposable element Tcb1 transposase [Trichonephila clavipes]